MDPMQFHQWTCSFQMDKARQDEPLELTCHYYIVMTQNKPSYRMALFCEWESLLPIHDFFK